MSYQDDFNLFVGAKYGIFKGIKATEGQNLISKSIQSLQHLSKDTDITALAWSNEEEEDVLIGLSNQVVKTYDTKGKAFTLSTDAKLCDGNGTCLSEGAICGISRFDGALVTATESGHVRVMRYSDSECINIFANGPISKMRHSKTHLNIIGTGGQENDLKLWDLNTGKLNFEAKNVPNDSLQLRVKVWVSDHVFLPDSDKVVVGSRYGYVRLYDPKAQRRPVVKVDMPDRSVNCITASHQDHTVLCGLTKGDIVAVDMRMGRTAQHYKGFVGAVRDVACHPSEPYIVSVGLDRFLRIHHASSKKLLLKEYIVSRANCVLMRSSFNLKPLQPKPEKKSNYLVATDELRSDGESETEEVKQFDDIFNSMEVVVDGATKKRKKGEVTSMKKDVDTPSKKKKSQLLVNPFAANESKPVRGKTSPKKSPKKEVTQDNCDDDSDDDLMIVSETVNNVTVPRPVEENYSEPDEAEGDSDELDDSQEESEEEDASVSKSHSKEIRKR